MSLKLKHAVTFLKIAIKPLLQIILFILEQIRQAFKNIRLGGHFLTPVLDDTN